MTFDGKVVAEFLRGKKHSMPGKAKIAAYAKKNNLTFLDFACAVHDFANGKWHVSQHRSMSCSLSANECYWNKNTGEVGQRKNRKRVKSDVPMSIRAGASGTAIYAGCNLCDIMAEQGCRCYACGIDLIKLGLYELDHIMPISKGGTNSYENIQYLCRKCNRQKSDRLPLIWAASLGIKLPQKFLDKYCEDH